MKITEELYGNIKITVEGSIDYLCKNVGFEEDEAQKLLKDYFNELDEGFFKLAGAMKTQDHYGLSRIAHGIKGSAGTNNLNELASLARNLELAALDKDLDECGKYADMINIYINNVKLYLEKRINNSII